MYDKILLYNDAHRFQEVESADFGTFSLMEKDNDTGLAFYLGHSAFTQLLVVYQSSQSWSSVQPTNHRQYC